MKILKYILITLTNYIPVLCAFFAYIGGAPVVWMLFIMSQIGLVVLNYKATDKISIVTFLSINLLASTIIANKLATYLYYTNVSSDGETLIVGNVGLWVGVIFVVILSLLSILLKVLICIYHNKSEKEQKHH